MYGISTAIKSVNIAIIKVCHISYKLKAFSFYSDNDIKCACCGERQMEFLSIDHIHGGGTKHRVAIGNKYIFLWLAQNNYPDGY